MDEIQAFKSTENILNFLDTKIAMITVKFILLGQFKNKSWGRVGSSLFFFEGVCRGQCLWHCNIWVIVIFLEVVSVKKCLPPSPSD